MPDISTPDALRQTLLNAKSITYMDPTKGTSGKHFASVLDQLGIADQMRAKTTLGDVGFVVEPVARGDLELGIQQITEILPVKGAKLVGPLPDALQKVCALLVDVAMASICVFGVFYGTQLCLGTMGQTLAELPWLPVGFTYIPLPLGALLTLIFVLEKLAFGSQHHRAVVRFDHSLEEAAPTPAGA